MFKKLIKKYYKIAILLGLIGVFFVAIVNWYVISKSEDYVITDINKLPKVDAVIVLGAKVTNEKLSYVLEDRVVAGVNIFYGKKAPAILLSGDHGQKEYDEVNGMRKYILRRKFAIPKQAIFMDHAGFDTYDSMIRALKVFNIKSAIIVTQDFHIHRSVYIARELGIKAYGFAVDESMYKISLRLNWKLREYLSRVKAYKDVLFNVEPKFLGEPIPITGNGMKSWDEI